MVILGLRLWSDISHNRHKMTIWGILSAVDSVVELEEGLGIHVDEFCLCCE